MQIISQNIIAQPMTAHQNTSQHITIHHNTSQHITTGLHGGILVLWSKHITRNHSTSPRQQHQLNSITSTLLHITLTTTPNHLNTLILSRGVQIEEYIRREAVGINRSICVLKTTSISRDHLTVMVWAPSLWYRPTLLHRSKRISVPVQWCMYKPVH